MNKPITVTTRPPKSRHEQYLLGLMFDPEIHLYKLANGHRLCILIPTLEDENDLVNFGEMDIGYLFEINSFGFKSVSNLLLFGERQYESEKSK